MRVMTPAFLAAISGALVRPALFVQVTFTAGPVYIWSGIGPIVWNGQTWIGLGSLVSISTIEEGSTVSAKGMTITLSGLDPLLLMDAMSEYQIGLPALIYFGAFDDSGVLIPNPVCCFSGRMDQSVIDISGTTAQLVINCESRLVEMNVSVERRYTDEDQQLDYPGDLGFSFVNGIQDAQIYFGRFPSNKNGM
jgi:hypothetical protein